MPQAPRDLIVRAGDEVRGTQSFVYVMASVWKRPSLTALEVLWRWAFGAVALWLLATNGRLVWLAATSGTGDASQLHLDHFSVTDPMLAATHIANAAQHILPPALQAALWLAPLLLALWVVASTMGRIVMLRRIDASLTLRPATLVMLGSVRVVCLAAVVFLWMYMLAWSGSVAVTGPAAQGAEPNLVLYFALVIMETLLIFIAWSVVSWVLCAAPLLAMLRGLGPLDSLRATLRLGTVRGKLIEINFVMGIVKVALVVLAMVFSATPLPFQTYTTDAFLRDWWVAVVLLYLVASDFFHVVRISACLALCRILKNS